MMNKGRAAWQLGTQRPPRGAAHPQAKLTPEMGDEIRALASSGERQRDIAALFGVSQRTVCKVLHGLSYV
jgi:DNA-binding MarR family transcriptional regulator